MHHIDIMFTSINYEIFVILGATCRRAASRRTRTCTRGWLRTWSCYARGASAPRRFGRTGAPRTLASVSDQYGSCARIKPTVDTRPVPEILDYYSFITIVVAVLPLPPLSFVTF